MTKAILTYLLIYGCVYLAVYVGRLSQLIKQRKDYYELAGRMVEASGLYLQLAAGDDPGGRWRAQADLLNGWAAEIEALAIEIEQQPSVAWFVRLFRLDNV